MPCGRELLRIRSPGRRRSRRLLLHRIQTRRLRPLVVIPSKVIQGASGELGLSKTSTSKEASDEMFVG
jgi:hypothetical protein